MLTLLQTFDSLVSQGGRPEVGRKAPGLRLPSSLQRLVPPFARMLLLYGVVKPSLWFLLASWLQKDKIRFSGMASDNVVFFVWPSQNVRQLLILSRFKEYDISAG